MTWGGRDREGKPDTTDDAGKGEDGAAGDVAGCAAAAGETTGSTVAAGEVAGSATAGVCTGWVTTTGGGDG
jgi:hypothetical protein